MRGVKFLAALLVIGGVFGAGLILLFLLTGKAASVGFLPMLALFAFGALAGVRLWQGRERGWKWGLILYAMQIPIFVSSGLAYEFYLGPAVNFMWGSVDDHFAFEFGANIHFYLGAHVSRAFMGLNLFALGAFFYLLLMRPPQRVLAADAPAAGRAAP